MRSKPSAVGRRAGACTCHQPSATSRQSLAPGHLFVMLCTTALVVIVCSGCDGGVGVGNPTIIVETGPTNVTVDTNVDQTQNVDVGGNQDTTVTETCGNGVCGSGESASTCPADCAGGSVDVPTGDDRNGEDDPCAGVDCPEGATCDPGTGSCVAQEPLEPSEGDQDELCADVICPQGEGCDAATGDCVSDGQDSDSGLTPAAIIFRAAASKLFDRGRDKPVALSNAVRGIALSGDGSKLWVMTDERGSTAEPRLFRIGTDGTGLTEVLLPSVLQDGFIEHTPALMAADSDGDTCIIEIEGGGDSVLWKATTSGLTRLLAVSDEGDAITISIDELEVTADGSTAIFLADTDCCGNSNAAEVYSLSASGVGIAVLLFDENDLVPNPDFGEGVFTRTIQAIEINSTGTLIAAIRQIAASPYPNEAFIFNTTAGSATQMTNFGVVGGEPVWEIRTNMLGLSMTSDGGTLALLPYNPVTAVAPEVPVVVGTPLVTSVVSDALDLDRVGISGDGSIVWGSNSSGSLGLDPRDLAARFNPDTGTHLVIDDYASTNTTMFSPCNCPGGGTFQVPDISQDGSVMVSADDDFAYVIHVGRPDAIQGGPMIDGISTFLSPSHAQLTVRVTVSDPDGDDDIQLVKITFVDAFGLDLDDVLDSADNPYFGERGGVAMPAGSTPGTYQATYLADDGTEDIVDTVRARVTVADGQSHYAVADFRLVPVPGELEDTNGDGTQGP